MDTRQLSGDILNLFKSLLAKPLARLKSSSSILAEASKMIAKSIFLRHVSVFPVSIKERKLYIKMPMK